MGSLRRRLEVGGNGRSGRTRPGKLDHIIGVIRQAGMAHDPEVIADDPIGLTLARLEEGLRDDGKEFHDMLPNQPLSATTGPAHVIGRRRRASGSKKSPPPQKKEPHYLTEQRGNRR
jgi:hypothetical protein